MVTRRRSGVKKCHFSGDVIFEWPFVELEYTREWKLISGVTYLPEKLCAFGRGLNVT